jgi:hypothetical protein
MKESNIIPHLTKLLKNLIFKDFDLEFKIVPESILSYNDTYDDYLITIYLDPELMCMSGDKYIPEANNFLYELEDNIHSVLPYVGLADSNVIVKFKFLNEKEFSNKLRGMINRITPELYNRIEDLPKLSRIKVGQRGDMAEFKASFKFDEYPKMGIDIIKLYEYIGELLPTFDDVYMDFGVD